MAGYTTAGGGPVVPANLEVPAGNRPLFHAYAKGVQIYRCTQDLTDTNRFSWTFTPSRMLTSTPSRPTAAWWAEHYTGPTWE